MFRPLILLSFGTFAACTPTAPNPKKSATTEAVRHNLTEVSRLLPAPRKWTMDALTFPGSTDPDVDVPAGWTSEWRFSYESPVPAAALRPWIADKLTRFGFLFAGKGNRFEGRTPDDVPFSLTVRDIGASRSEAAFHQKRCSHKLGGGCDHAMP